MVYVYIKECDKLPDPLECPSILEGLSEERKKKILNYKFTEKRRQCLGASLLLKNILERYGYCLEDIYYGEKGKPELNGLFFNLSHSENIAICAVSDKGNVGCDVEMVRRAPLKLAERYFSEHEVEYLEQLDMDEKNTAFYRFWTLKESYTKMTGEGIGIGLDTVEIHLDEQINIYRDGQKCDCLIREYEIPGYRVAICTEDDENVFMYHQI